MSAFKKHGTVILSVLCLVVMIIYGQQGSSAAREGLSLCTKVVIPSLFPFFVISIYLNSRLSEIPLKLLRPIGKLCAIPSGSESVFLLGLLGGYPVGAQSISLWYEQGLLEKSDAQRMLGFCNNTGPAFIFGMLSAFFPSQWHLWALWLVQICSAIITGVLLPGRTNRSIVPPVQKTVTLPQALERALKSICFVCGWVILFKILISLLSEFMSSLPLNVQAVLNGFIELTNGCMTLISIPSLGVRFVIASVLLSFGGLCVHMQTASVAQSVGLKYHTLGKVLQTVVSFLLSMLLQSLLFSY